MLWLRKGFGFAGAWTVCEQNELLGVTVLFWSTADHNLLIDAVLDLIGQDST